MQTTMNLPADIIEVLDREVGRLYDMRDPAPKDAALIAAVARRLSKTLDLIAKDCERSLAGVMEGKGLENWVLVSGDQMFHVERTTSTSVRGVQTDKLVGAVMRRAARSPRADPVTGEVIPTAETQLKELLECFQPNPRWGALAQRDIHRDEYAEVRKTPSAKVTEVASD